MRIPKQLHRILVDGAKKEGISLNQYVQLLLTSAAVAESFENIIDNYNQPVAKNKELTLITKSKYVEAV